MLIKSNEIYFLFHYAPQPHKSQLRVRFEIYTYSFSFRTRAFFDDKLPIEISAPKANFFRLIRAVLRQALFLLWVSFFFLFGKRGEDVGWCRAMWYYIRVLIQKLSHEKRHLRNVGMRPSPLRYGKLYVIAPYTSIPISIRIHYTYTYGILYHTRSRRWRENIR